MEENKTEIGNEKIKEENIDVKVENTENGIEISNDVIAVIAGVAVSEVQGVASMSGGFAGRNIRSIKWKEKLSKRNKSRKNRKYS